MRRREFLRKHRGVLYTGLLFSGKLNAHLEEIDHSANEMFDLLIKQHAECEGVSEQLKARNQRLWTRQMNSVRDRAIEIINHELIYA